MSYTIMNTGAAAASEPAAAVEQDAAARNTLAESGVRMLRAHNLRKQANERGEKDNRVALAMRGAATAWQEANMAAAAGETLLSRVIGAHVNGLGPTATPALIAEVVEMRARASDLLYDVLMLVR